MVVSNSTQTKAEIQEVVNGLDISITNLKWRKWKMQATSKESCRGKKVVEEKELNYQLAHYNKMSCK